jgi:uncharacterized protein (UPF0261 family)
MPVCLLSTLDTKGREIAFLKGILEGAGRAVTVVDAGLFEPDGIRPDISRFEVAAAAAADLQRLIERPREQVIETMGRGAGEILKRLEADGRLDAVLGVGGNQGTAIVCAAMREVSLGLPKLVVSTVASGNIRPYIGASDIAVLFSIGDLQGGPNPVVRPVLQNAVRAMIGMTASPGLAIAAQSKPLVAITALGNTQPAASRLFERLRQAGVEVAAFHASGSCGSAMEGLISAGKIAAVIELTPHELTEEVIGAGWYQPVRPGRLTAAGLAGVPQVVAPGSMEYLCFGPKESVPPRFRRRPTYFHNASNANVRTTRREMAAVGKVLAERLNRSVGPVAVVLPMHGWSIYGAPGGPLHDAKADAAFVNSLTEHLRPEITVHKLPLHINEPAFADHCFELLSGFLALRGTASVSEREMVGRAATEI